MTQADKNGLKEPHRNISGSYMKRAPIRASLFNISFILLNALCCIIFLPALLLPRPLFIKAIHIYHLIIYWHEKLVLGLDYEVRGREHVPQDGAFIVASKHMSTYETFKLRLILNDPAIILKKELLRIPLWGAFLKKSDVIAIDRSNAESARKSLASGVERMKVQGRPVVIFPQGTRVWPRQTAHDKPYKRGIFHIHETSGLSVIPMATNSGMYWPRSGWLKSNGTVVFEFLPPIEEAYTHDKAAFMRDLETRLEVHSDALMRESMAEKGKK